VTLRCRLTLVVVGCDVVGRLLEFDMGFGELAGELWHAIEEDTIVWGVPDEALKSRRRERRKRIFSDSAVPWILNDIGGLAQFYDDIQDIVSFARWNRKLVGAKGLRACMKANALKGRTGVASLTGCMCPFSKASRKKMTKSIGPATWALLGPLTVMALRLFPATAPIMWAMLAGQVLATATGYGISFGPVVGAGLELFWRGLAEVGLPFGREHNKWYQLKQARALQKAPQGVAASRHLDWEDRLLAMVGLRLIARDGERLPQLVVDPKDYPKFEDIFEDPIGLFATLAGMFGSLVPNAAAYLANDFLGPIWEGLIEMATGKHDAIQASLGGNMAGALTLLEGGGCPGPEACAQVMEDALALAEFAKEDGMELDWKGAWGVLLDFFTNWFSGYGLSGLLLEQPK
jgi:hypothetical protein